MWFKSIKLVKVTGKDRRKKQDQLAYEKELTLDYGHSEPVHFYTIPHKEKQLGLGYLLSHGYQPDPDALKLHGNQLICSSCPKQPIKAKEKSNFTISPDDIFKLTAYFQEKALLFKETAICESAALVSPSDILVHAEDLDRLNAFYKVIGEGFLEDIPFQEVALLTSEKIDLQLVRFLDTLQIPMVISRTGITTNAYDFCKDNDIAAVGFARGTKLSLY